MQSAQTTFARVTGAAVAGAAARLVDVQVRVAPDEGGESGIFRIVGLPDSALREGQTRIKQAIRHGGWHWPHCPVHVNLAPAAARKEGAALDLPIAIGVLGATGCLRDARGGLPPLCDWLCLGELTLDGRVRPVRGVLAAAEAAVRGRRRFALVAQANATEAAAIGGLEVYGVGDLAAAVGHLTGRAPLAPVPTPTFETGAFRVPSIPVRGQPGAVRAAWVAAAGRHNLLLSGPPGSGKSLLARHLADMLPPLERSEAIEASRVHSVAGLLDGGLLRRRPFRAPHHTTSLAGLVGGGRHPRPGEISLAHLGVLFLDELAEFPRATLEALRQPLEDGALAVGRAAGRARFPADIVLVAATNPCPCGWHGVEGRCRCPAHVIERYRMRVSGPLRDRFDLQVEVRPVDPERLVKAPDPPPFPADAVAAARVRQRGRAARLRLPATWNGRIPGAAMPDAVEPTSEARARLVQVARRTGLSARGVHRCLRVARTLADLDGSAKVGPPHVLEALAFRAG